MRLRPFVAADTDAVLDLWFRASQVGHAFLSDAFFVEERRLLAERWLPASDTTVCELDGRVVGFVSMHGDEVGGLFVDPDHHRRGIASRLLDHVRASGTPLTVTVFEANEVGRGFYEAYGFQLVERRTSDVEDQPELRMALPAPRPA